MKNQSKYTDFVNVKHAAPFLWIMHGAHEEMVGPIPPLVHPTGQQFELVFEETGEVTAIFLPQDIPDGIIGHLRRSYIFLRILFPYFVYRAGLHWSGHRYIS